MSRKELYERVKKEGFAAEIKKVFGCNFTNCSNEQLENFIKKATQTEKPCDCGPRFITLINILKERHLLLQSDIDKIMNY